MEHGRTRQNVTDRTKNYGGIDSLIPIICNVTCDAQAAVLQIVDFIKDEVGNLDKVIANLFEKYSHEDEKTGEQIARYVEGCLYNITGCGLWSLETNRYGLSPYFDEKGEIVMIL